MLSLTVLGFDIQAKRYREVFETRQFEKCILTSSVDLDDLVNDLIKDCDSAKDKSSYSSSFHYGSNRI